MGSVMKHLGKNLRLSRKVSDKKKFESFKKKVSNNRDSCAGRIIVGMMVRHRGPSTET